MLYTAILVAVIAWLVNKLFRVLAGDFRGRILSSPAQAYVEKYDTDVIDYHSHALGFGNGSKCYINPAMRQWRRPKTLAIMSAAGVHSWDEPDARYIDQLDSLIQHKPGHVARKHKMVLLAFDE